MDSETQTPAERKSLSATELAARIDHTLLAPEATRDQVLQLCDEAPTHGFHAACVAGRWIPLAADKLHDSNVKVVAVVGFPFGAETTKIKVAQAKEAAHAGADEIEVVADLAAIIEDDGRYLLRQLQAVLRVCRSMKPPIALKVIIEAAKLTTEQKVFAYRAAEQVGADLVSTGTGWQPAAGATTADIALIKEAAPHCKVKAAGVQTAEQMIAMLQAGAERIGSKSGVQIMRQFEGDARP
jgi:deoxyribose-phosphate aldolase